MMIQVQSLKNNNNKNILKTNLLIFNIQTLESVKTHYIGRQDLYFKVIKKT